MYQESDNSGIVISNFATHHVFQAARAAAENGLLQRFYTGIYYNSEQPLYRWLDKSFASRCPDIAERLHSRQESSVDPYAVSRPLLRLIPKLLSQLPLLKGRSIAVTCDLIGADLYDRSVARQQQPPCSIFHAFESCALFSFQRAKKLDAILVLDQPAMHIDTIRRLAQVECDRHGISLPDDPPLYRRAIERKYAEMEMADYIFVGSQLVKDSLTYHGIPDSKIFIIPYGVEPNGLFRPYERPERKDFTMLYVGPLTWYRGLPYLLDAYQRLNIPNSRLVIIGREQPGWGTYFRKRISSMPSIQWIPGVSQNELANWYRCADVLVFPSVVGGISMVVYEAMSTGLPAVVSDGEIAIRDCMDGLVASPHEPDAIEKAIRRLYEEPELRRQIGVNASIRARAFSWAIYRENVVNAYRQIMVNR